jgi:RNA polymerase sigma-70 factor (ECF subfamily)
MFSALMGNHIPIVSMPPPRDVNREAADLRPIVRAVVANVLRESPTHVDVEDCTHEALRRAFEHTDKLAAADSLRAWVIAIARNVALDAIRARRRERSRAAHESTRDESSPLGVDRVADAAPDPFERIASAERDRIVRDAIERLPLGQRKAISMFHLEGLDYEHISTKLNVPVGTVATWISRGRRTIADAMQTRARDE